jgi:hypothetical protein
MTLQAAPGIPVGLAGLPAMARLIVVGPDFEVAVELSDHLWQGFCAISRGGHVPEFKKWVFAQFHCVVCKSSTTRVVRLRRSLSNATCKNAHRKNKVQDDRSLSVPK